MYIRMGISATVIQYSMNVRRRKKKVKGRTKLEQEQIWNGYKMFPRVRLHGHVSGHGHGHGHSHSHGHGHDRRRSR